MLMALVARYIDLYRMEAVVEPNRIRRCGRNEFGENELVEVDGTAPDDH
jgi:hypothetical protein